MRATALLCLLATACWASAASSASASCPNEAFRSEQGLTDLPACMALEMVSPPAKALQPAYWPSFSLNGERVLYRSLAALADTPGYQLFTGDRYVASRSAAGWATAATSPPASYAFFTGGAERAGPFFFTPDLGGWMLTGATKAQEPAGVAQVFRGGLGGGSLEPVSPLLAGIDNSGNTVFQFSPSAYTGSATSEDLSTTVIQVNQSSISLIPGDPSGDTFPSQEPGGDRNSYVAFRDGSGAPHLELLTRAGDGTVYGGRCGAHSGGLVPAAAAFPKVYQGAISPDGSRIFLTTRPDQPYDELAEEGPPCDPANGLRIMERTETAPGNATIAEIAPGGPAVGDDLYQAASREGTKVYFASPRKLTASDADASSEPCGASLGASKGCDLYLYDASLPPGSRLVQASAGGTGDSTPGKGANVLSLATAISGDGSHAYFVAQGVLTTDPNPEGATASAGQPNLYLYERDAASPSGRTAFIGTLASGDAAKLWGTEGSFFGDATAVPLHGGEAGGDGHVLFLASKAPLTADDLDGGHRDVFRYDAEEETLERISKPNPGSGGADNGPFDVTVNPSLPAGLAPASNFGERTRWAGEDGETVAFITTEALDPADEDAAPNPYFFTEGQLASVRAEAEDPPSVSPPGNAIGFATKTALLPQDRDLVRDVYVLRTDGGFAPPSEVIADCVPPGCQPPAPPPPSAGASGTASAVRGEEKIPVKCKKNQVKKKGKCVKKKAKKQKKKKKKSSKSKGGER
ncbi:MAG TPA: hypothetical protein VFR04_08850 [Solirubrobacterales bacterium]|nr:hypothetical protein [Solirubrobacterales bacterium]